MKVNHTINKLAISAITMSGLGLLFGLMFLQTGNFEDLIIAGFIFLASTILFGTGLITLGIYNKK